MLEQESNQFRITAGRFDDFCRTPIVTSSPAKVVTGISLASWVVVLSAGRLLTFFRPPFAHLSRSELDGFWIHVDADCLDDAVMPAVDFRLPDGLSPEELETVLRMALDSDHAVGLEITIYNPALDSDGRAGRLLTDVLMRALV